MCEFIEKYFIAISGGILSVCFTAYIAWRAFKKQRFVSAADKFYVTILKEFEGLYPTQTNWPSMPHKITGILNDKFSRLESAVIEFRRYLGPLERRSFDRAWVKYQDDYHAYQPHRGYSCDKDGNITDECDTTHTYYPLFKQNIESLLNHAKPK